MKRFVLLVFLLFLSKPINSQLLYAEWGQVISSFDYENSAGGTLENLQSKMASSLNAGYHFQLRGDKVTILVGGVFNTYGAVASDALLDNYFEWDVSYAGLQTGLTYYFARSKAFQFYVKPTVSMEYMVRGTQTLNNQIFDLSGEDEFDNLLLVPRMGLGIQYPISHKAALYLNYAYGRSFSLTKARPEDNEKLNINMHTVGIGIVIQLPGCNCAFKSF